MLRRLPGVRADSFGDVAEDVAADVLVALGDADVVSRPNREISPGKFAFLEMLEYVGSRVKIVIWDFAGNVAVKIIEAGADRWSPVAAAVPGGVGAGGRRAAAPWVG
ncbi:hypothetical protein [Saccharopolyspora sp. SCSIO 74807]|uniref:hypothetical protein n=1 Tax=Saccharopolyspora sp. SCSIO 74807 TaxID=3118084 RepID=UPI0030CAB389